jgi:hypothetical protein
MYFSSFLCVLLIGYVQSLFIMYFIADTLCCIGWHDVLCIKVSVVVGFLYILNVRALSVLCIVMSK